MWDRLIGDLSSRGATVLFGLLLGATTTWLIARWRMYKLRQNILKGDARDTIVIHQHVIEYPAINEKNSEHLPSPILRIRSVGQGELQRVIPNDYLATVLAQRAGSVTTDNTLICMSGAEGSYILETLTNFVCDRVSNRPFEHDLYVMAPCCEPAGMAYHQPISILLISLNDLELFENWSSCKEIRVEHGSDGSRILTLMLLAQRYRSEQKEILSRRAAGERTTHLETMYILDLALDKRTVGIAAKPIPWERFENDLKQLGLPLA